jgi:hypothetical protein
MLTPDQINLFIAIGTLITAFATIILALVTQATVRQAKKDSRGDFLLRLDEAFRYYQPIHSKLRPKGPWAGNSGGPESNEDWIAVEGYMGLFERVQILIEQKVIDIATIERLYGYRVSNIVANTIIYNEKLTGPLRNDWSDFVKLWEAVEKARAIRKQTSKPH